MSHLERIRSKVATKLEELKALIEEIDRELNAEDHFYLSQTVESMKFYGTGDEGIELFQSTCTTAYQMNGIGEKWQAILLVLFAAEQADNSVEWKEDDNDFEYGQWG